MQKSDNEFHYDLTNLDNDIDDPNFDRKFNQITEGAPVYLKEHLRTRITPENLKIIVDYIQAFQMEAGPSQRYRVDTTYKLKQLAEYYNPRSFTSLTRQDIVGFLDHFRKPESVDPLHKWVGTHETTRIYLLRFFKWLHRPNDDIAHKKRPTPGVMQHISKISAKRHQYTSLLIYGLNKTTRCFTSIVLLFGIDAGMPWPETPAVGRMRCSSSRLKMLLYNN